MALNSSGTAILVLDYQVGRLKPYVAADPEITNRLAGVLGAARNADMFVAHVVLGFRPGYPEIHQTSGGFAQVKDKGLWLSDDPRSAIPSELGPEEGDVVLTKHRTGAFPGTDLDLILRSCGISTVVIAGLTTGGTVLSTLRYAVDIDYRAVVVSDCCADECEEVHRVLMEGVFPRHAQIMTSKEVVGAIAK